jgi:hypothetical protein
MHVEVDQLDNVNDVRVGEQESQTRWRPWLVCPPMLKPPVHHANSLKNIESKLTLSEEEPVHLMLYRDSQKMI